MNLVMHRRRRAAIHRLGLLIAAAGLSIAVAQTAAQAASGDLTLLCPSGATGEPRLKNPQTGQTQAITDAGLRAVATAACGLRLLGTPDIGPVKFVNRQTRPIYVGFSGTGSIHYDAGAKCTVTGNGLKIAAGAICTGTVDATNSGSRFCASPFANPNCTRAQDDHLTLIETAFDTKDQCQWTHDPGTCVSYDVSVIPTSCTVELWRQNQCASGGGASYNLPVELSCAGTPPAPSFSCRGPTDGTYGPQKYPRHCGNPNATCVGNTQACVNAYFFPMFTPPENKYQPTGVCTGGRTLTITFLSGS
ncbi:MAG TPA: hypothetical protein VGF34_06615 [Stellaceae bacterium]